MTRTVEWKEEGKGILRIEEEVTEAKLNEDLKVIKSKIESYTESKESAEKRLLNIELTPEMSALRENMDKLTKYEAQEKAKKDINSLNESIGYLTGMKEDMEIMLKGNK
jgi:hypothetical protein